MNVVISERDGSAYHRIDSGGTAVCGCLDKAISERQDTGQQIIKGDDLDMISKREAENSGFKECRRCFTDE